MDKKPIIGKYILDTLSIGMYNYPLMILREYIQNSTDAIDDKYKDSSLKFKYAKIEIIVNGQTKSLTIKDNGIGISSYKAWDILHNIGLSVKKVGINRGFRGIGRLGGLGYCRELIFITKFEGEKRFSTSKWNCDYIRELISKSDDNINITDVIKNVTTFKQESYNGDVKDHFFIVEMNDIRSSRDSLMNVPLMKNYLSEVAPVPFNDKTFRYASKIENELRTKIKDYETYDITVNDEKIYKSYKDTVCIGKKVYDKIEDVEYYEFTNNGPLSFAWLAKLKLLGAVKPSDLVDGIRVRAGNILIGNKNLMSDFFTESRFNNYLIGEIHIADNRLIPNSRRDDLEDNKYKEEFYNCFIKEIGIPFSKKIREASILRSQLKNQKKGNNTIENIKKIIKYGYFCEEQKKELQIKLKQIEENSNKIINDEGIQELALKLKNSKHYLDNNYKFKNKKLFKSVFETIYKNSTIKIEAEKIIYKIIKSYC